MSRRIDIELTSTRDDGSWTWRAAGAREPKGTLDGAILPAGVSVGDVLRAEIEGYLDGLTVVSVVPPRSSRPEPERLELLSPRRETPLVTADVRKRPDRGRRSDKGRRGRDEGDRPRRDGGRDRDRDRQARHERRPRPDRPAAPSPAEARPKPKRLRPARSHRAALLESLPTEQRPIAEQLLQGGIPAVRQAIDKQNESLRSEGKPEVSRDSLLKVAEDLRPRAQAALWRDRAEAAAASVDELDLRDLRSVVNAAGDAGRDEEARALANQLREALANRVEKEHAAWLAELSEMLRDGRVVRALRLSSRPPKAGSPIPADLTDQLAAAASAALTEETGQDRWATVLDALAYSPVRRRVIPESLPSRLSPELRETVARLGSRLPEIAHIFAIEPDESAGRPARPARRRGGRGDDRSPGGGRRGGGGRGARSSGSGRSGSSAPPSERKQEGAEAQAEPASQAEDAEAQVAESQAEPEPQAEVAGAQAEQEPEGAELQAEPEPQAQAADAPAEPEAQAEAAQSLAEQKLEGAEAQAADAPGSPGEPDELPDDGEHNGQSPVIEAGTMPADERAG